MDDQTRLARYESMRKGHAGGGGRGGGSIGTSLGGSSRLSENKKLFLVHMDLRKQCERLLRSYARDATMATQDWTHRQKAMMEKRRQLQRQIEIFQQRSYSNMADVGHEQSATENHQEDQSIGATTRVTDKPSGVDPAKYKSITTSRSSQPIHSPREDGKDRRFHKRNFSKSRTTD